MSNKEKLLRLKRCNVFNNGLVNHENGKLVLYSEVEDLLRDETSGANVVYHNNPDPDGNESDGYICITSDKLNLCLTLNQLEDAKKRYNKHPWLPKPKAKSPAKKKRVYRRKKKADE